ncbi:MAG TPA: hypothetical protein VGY31_08720 [Terriglobia bacterium]|nr:hypothetical protein [Terriglobia bacterium]
MRRRNFLKDTAVGLTGFAAMGGVKANAQQGLRVDQAGDIGNTFKTGWGDGIGRPVRIASIGFKDGSLPLEKMAALVDKEGTHGPDVIVLPELCRGQDRESE